MNNIIEKIKKVKVNRYYDITTEDYKTICESSKANPGKTFYYFFLAGYMQGKKAAIAESKKRHK